MTHIRKQLAAQLRLSHLTRPKRASDAIQPFREHFRIHTHADAKVVGHFEEAARNCRCFEFRSQTLKENIGLSIPQSHE